MGLRSAGAIFMPSRAVFPGGAAEPCDALLPPGAMGAAHLGPAERSLALTAIRELWEETGLILGRPGRFDALSGWKDFAATGCMPSCDTLRYVFRAITPPARPRRFDARFFLADASAVAGGADAPLGGDGELGDLRWIPLDAVDDLKLAFVTRMVLAEVRVFIAGRHYSGVPVWDGERGTVRRR